MTYVEKCDIYIYMDRYVDLYCEEVDGVVELIEMYNQMQANK